MTATEAGGSQSKGVKVSCIVGIGGGGANRSSSNDGGSGGGGGDVSTWFGKHEVLTHGMEAVEIGWD